MMVGVETPKRGRPPKPEGTTLVNVGIALHAATIVQLRAVCAAEGLTQTAIVESALKREFRRLARRR